jgi:hypothetical protein
LGNAPFWGVVIAQIKRPTNQSSHSFAMVDRFPYTNGFNEQEGGNEVTQQFLAPRTDAAWINAQLSHLAATAANAQKKQSEGQDTATTALSGGTSSSSMVNNKDGGVQRPNVSGGFPLPKKWGQVSRDTAAALFSHPLSPRRNSFPLPKLKGQNRLIYKKPKLLSYKSLWDRSNPETRQAVLELQMQRGRVKIQSHNLSMNYHRDNPRQNLEVPQNQGINLVDKAAMAGPPDASSNDVQNEHGTTQWEV